MSNTSAIKRIEGYCCEVTPEQWRGLVKVADEVGVYLWDRSWWQVEKKLILWHDSEHLLKDTSGFGDRTLIPFDSFLAKLRGEEQRNSKIGVADLGEYEAINVRSEHEDLAIRTLMHESGLKWSDGDSYMDGDAMWDIYRVNTCYYPKAGTVLDMHHCKKHGFVVHNADIFIPTKLSAEEPTTAIKPWTPKAGEMVEVGGGDGEYFLREFIAYRDGWYVCWREDAPSKTIRWRNCRPARPRMTRAEAEAKFNIVITDEQ